MEIRKAMLLAAGQSRRLGDLAGHLPKPMLPIGGRPLMEHTVRRLADAGVTDVMVNLHHQGGAIQEHFRDGSDFGLRMHYSHEPQLLGTAGGLRQCGGFFRGAPFFVIYGDNLTTCDLPALAAHHERCQGIGTIALFWRDDVSAHSSVETDGATRITRFVEKPKPSEASSHWISAGIIVFEAAVLEKIPATVPCDFGFDVFPGLLAGGEGLYGYRMTGSEGLWWIDTAEHYQRTQALWKQGAPLG
ncbi:MAG: nucleotidyltransferase family protein [Acidobacteriota bacterium]